MSRKIPAILLAVAAIFALGVTPASASPLPKKNVDVQVLPTASLSKDGAVLTARLRVLCQAEGYLWEYGFVRVQQGNAYEAVTFNFTCDGRSHMEEVELRNWASQPTWFVRGEATIYAALLDEYTLTLYGDERQAKVH